MLRAFDQPAGIMLTKQERQSMDVDKEEEVLLLKLPVVGLLYESLML